MNMDCRVTLGDWETQRAAAQTIRRDVFVLEQQVPLELEWDDMDALSLHAVAYDQQQQALGTGRLLPDGHIGRMAVCKTARGAGIGAKILQTLMAAARERGDAKIMLNAQLAALPFYKRYGFVEDGEEFVEAGLRHVRMWVAL